MEKSHSIRRSSNICGGFMGRGGVYGIYVGVIWFIFHVLQFLLIKFTHRKLLLHWQNYDETSAKIGLKIGPPLI